MTGHDIKGHKQKSAKLIQSSTCSERGEWGEINRIEKVEQTKHKNPKWDYWLDWIGGWFLSKSNKIIF